MNDGFEAREDSQPDRSLEAAVRRVFDDVSRDEFGEPADVFAVTRDDELLDWLGAVDLDAEPAPPPAQDPADAELIEMLLAWRRSVTTNASELAPQPAPEAADTTGRRHAGRLRRVPAMSAVFAVLMVCVGLGVAVQDASPGDPLWGVSKALNSGRAASIEGTAQTRRYLDVAHTELLLGHQAAAAAALAAAQQQIAQMRSDDDKRELQARQRELANQLNSTPTSGQASGSRAATPPSRRREDRTTSVRADEQQPRPSRTSIPHAAATAGTPSTTTEPSMSNERETRTPDSSAAASDTRRPSRSATELTESAAIVAGSHVEDSRDSDHPPPDRPRKNADTAAAVSSGSSSGSAQPPPTSGAPRSGNADRAANTNPDSRYERHAESSQPSSATDAQPTTRPAQSRSQRTANRDSSASPTPTRHARPVPQPKPSSTSSSAVEADETALPKDKPADKPKDKTARERRRTSAPPATPDPAHTRASGADMSADRVYGHKGATVTADSSGQHRGATTRSSHQEPTSPGSTARPGTHDHPPTATSATPTVRDHRDEREQP
jgi:hypothetical protein